MCVRVQLQKRKFETPHGSHGELGYGIGQVETGICFDIKIFGINTLFGN